MSEMIERVARAIYDAQNGIDGDQVGDMLYTDHRIDGPDAETCRAQVMRVCNYAARAAIAAMREPTEVMIEASNREWDGRMSYRSSGAWQAMIDAALSEKSGNADP